MKQKSFFKGILIITISFMSLNFFSINTFSATTDKDFILDDNVGDSPQVIIKDQDENNLIFQKLDSGEANIINDEGSINIKPSGDLNNYFQMLTIANGSYLYWFINGYTNLPGFRVNPATGKLEYRDEDAVTWVELDNLSGSSTDLGDLADVNFGGGPSQGELLYYNSLDWVNLPVGVSGQVLQTQGAGANPVWASVSVSDELVKA
ncbi:hypothetical protein KAI68_04885, partial [bacterium]|nr:hypothetical protein [bacterium]